MIIFYWSGLTVHLNFTAVPQTQSRHEPRLLHCGGNREIGMHNKVYQA